MSKDPKDEIAHKARIEAYATRVGLLYNTALKELSALAANLDYDPAKPFSFAKFPAIQKRLKEALQSYASLLNILITKGTTASWYASLRKTDTRFPIQNIYTARNKEALQAFQKRVTAGLNLSERVWKYSEQLQQEVELALSGGIITGKSAAEIARSVKSQLKEPDKLFRRVRDQYGVLQLSKNAKAYKPGQGVYRSSYKNALRLTRNEINDAYRSADYFRWSTDESVIGFEVKLSNRHRIRDLCDDLKGKYPKTFKFRMWHTNCLCYVVPILMNDEDFDKLQQATLAGEELPGGFVAEGAINDVPTGFKTWIKENKTRIDKMKSKPYFIQDNFKGGEISEGWKLDLPAKKSKPVKTDEQKADIQRRWNERAEKNNKLNEVVKKLESAKVEYNEVKMLNGQLDELEIITRVGGGDLTKGSCSSLAFAYAGNRFGFDVLDFRDGASRFIFSSGGTIRDIAERVGGIITENTNDFANANDLLKEVKEGKEYYFTCGNHAAIVRKGSSGFLEYLELQSPNKNGFKPLTTSELTKRFGAKKSRALSGIKVKMKDCLIDIDLLKKNTAFKKMLGYINTPEGQQKKGAKGSIK